MFKTNKEF